MMKQIETFAKENTKSGKKKYHHKLAATSLEVDPDFEKEDKYLSDYLDEVRMRKKTPKLSKGKKVVQKK